MSGELAAIAATATFLGIILIEWAIDKRKSVYGFFRRWLLCYKFAWRSGVFWASPWGKLHKHDLEEILDSVLLVLVVITTPIWLAIYLLIWRPFFSPVLAALRVSEEQLRKSLDRFSQ